MAYAAYREHSGVPLPHCLQPSHVLDVVVPCTVAGQVRRALARCDGVGVLRCEPLLDAQARADDDVLRVRLVVSLPLSSYGAVLHGVLLAAPCGEIGRLLGWRDHLARCGLRHG
ncbi:hypothetical protein [Pseudorhodoferax sp.]|uniref:hypothetical protein n=1 Tax=Pseudorhodoferax sp. TaxID=1993553 RepID=UPI002DD632E3|nr:hypothetical protein [Pseudorhodoferax sp.]